MSHPSLVKKLVEKANKELKYEQALEILLKEDAEFITKIFYPQFASQLATYVSYNNASIQKKAYDVLYQTYMENKEKIRNICQHIINDNYPFLFNGKRCFTSVNFPKAGNAPAVRRSKTNWTDSIQIAAGFASSMGNPNKEKGETEKSSGMPGTSGVIVYVENLPNEKIIIDVDNFRWFLYFVEQKLPKDHPYKKLNFAALDVITTENSGFDYPKKTSADGGEGEVISEPVENLKVVASYKVGYETTNNNIILDEDFIDVTDIYGDKSSECFASLRRMAKYYQTAASSVHLFGDRFASFDIKNIPNGGNQFNPEFSKEQIKEIENKYKQAVTKSNKEALDKKLDTDLSNDPVNVAGYGAYGQEIIDKGKKILNIMKKVPSIVEAKTLEELNLALVEYFSRTQKFKRDKPYIDRLLNIVNQASTSNAYTWTKDNCGKFENIDQMIDGYINYLQTEYFPSIKFIVKKDDIYRSISFSKFTFKKPEVKKSAPQVAPQATPQATPQVSDDAWKKYLPSFRSKEWNKGKTDDQLKPAILAWLAKTK